jgi:hypothetical protein
MIFFTNFGIPKQYDGCTRGPFIFIRPEYSENYGLIEHEKVHVKQFWRTFGFHVIFSLLSSKYRLRSEIEAYKRQMDVIGDKTDPSIARVAKMLHENYNLKFSLQEIIDEFDK